MFLFTVSSLTAFQFSVLDENSPDAELDVNESLLEDSSIFSASPLAFCSSTVIFSDTVFGATVCSEVVTAIPVMAPTAARAISPHIVNKKGIMSGKLRLIL